MSKIRGNLTAQLQIKTASAKNDIGEAIQTWTTVNQIFGWLDLAGDSSGHSKYTSYDTKIQESTHVFICRISL